MCLSRIAVFLIVLYHPLFLYATLIEDLQAIFGSKHCVEASLVSISMNEGDNTVMLDKSSVTEEHLFNYSRSTFTSATSKLNELAQYHGIEVVYKLVSEEGPPHAKTFTITLTLGDENYMASGASLKKAKQSAATIALQNTLYEHLPQKIKENQENLQTPTVLLNNIAMKLGIHVSYYLLNGQEEQTIHSYGYADEPYGQSKALYPKINSSFEPLRIPVEEPHLSGPFVVKVKVGEFIFKGIGHTLQAARHDAAFKALRSMQEQALFKDNVCSQEDSAPECKQKKESLKSPISRVHEAAQKHNLPVDFNVISETGKSHKKVFVTQCILGDFITQGEGTSKKESKKTAAEKMLKHLSQLPEKYNENEILRSLSSKKQKKKKKIVKNNVNSFVRDLAHIATSLWSENGKTANSYQSLQNNDKTVDTSKYSSLKDQILQIGNQLNIPMDFMDLSQHGDSYFSLMTLSVTPTHMCLGEDRTREKSHEAAALHAIKFLYHSRIFEETKFLQFKKLLSDFQITGFEDEAEYKYFEYVLEKPE